MPERGRARLLLAVGAAAIVGILLIGVAVLVAWHPGNRPASRPTAAEYAASPQVVEPASPLAAPSTAVTTTQSPSPSRKATQSPSRRPSPPPPTKKATTIPGPPAPPKEQPSSGPNCPTFFGTADSPAAVRTALDSAATHAYYKVKPVKVPKKLLYAVAFMESSWRSTVVSCDGGRGLMQIMPATATWMNQFFDTSWQIDTLSGNAYLGGQYLSWLVAYFAELYWSNDYDYYDEATDTIVNEQMLDSIISAYNFGQGAVDPTKGAAGIPNPSYVAKVRQYMTSCPCSTL